MKSRMKQQNNYWIESSLFGLIAIMMLVMISCSSSKEVIDPEEDVAETKSDISMSDPKTASSILISGFVLDERGAPLIGANVVEKGTSNGTISDADGSYSISVRPDAALTVSFTGYNDREIEIGDQTSIDIKLEFGSEMLDEVVLDGASSTSKSASIMVRGGPGPSRMEAGTSTRSAKRPIPDSPGIIEEYDNSPEAKAGSLTAGEWNDLYNWDDWKELLNNQDYNEMQSHWKIHPRSRYSVFVRNQYELPLHDVRVILREQSGQKLWESRTDNSGKAELWSDIYAQDKSFEPVDAEIIINGKTISVENLKSIEEGVNHVDVDMECISSKNVDVLFAVDATGSMSDEIRFLQSELQDVIERAKASNTGLNLRLGSIFYRDSTDAYLTKVQPFSEDASKTMQFIGEQSADGGGDYPEAVDEALNEALAQDWSEDAVARIIFLLLDAPPHHNESTLTRIQEQVRTAAELGIKIIPITASGINRQTEFLMKFMAIATNGTYVFITDHSGIGNPHLDPVVEDFEVEKLNNLLVRLLYNYTKSNGCDANEPANQGIAVYPNPTRDFVNIDTELPLRSLKVLSNSGKLISEIENVKAGISKVSLEGLIDGVYTIYCEGENEEFRESVVVVNN